MLERREFWSLTVSYWPQAAELGLKPRECVRYADLDDPARYRPHVFNFVHAPSRQDFLDMLKQLPWTQCWNDTLLPIIAKNQWPFMDYMHKRSDVDLVNEKDQIVGKLTSQREDQFRNPTSEVVTITIAMEKDALKGLTPINQTMAQKFMDKNQNHLLEMTLDLPHDHDAVVFMLKNFLFKHGFRKSKPSRKKQLA